MKGPDWGNRFFKKPKSFPLVESPVPQGVDWDLWQGPTGPARYHQLYHPMTWRGFNRYGTGQFGDWFCHIADAPVWLLDLYEPVSIEAEWVEGGDEVLAVDGCRVRFEFERRGDKTPCTFYWHNGVGDRFRPSLPKDWSWPENVAGNGGSFYYGTKNNAYTAGLHHTLRLADMQAQRELNASGYPEQTIPRVEGGPVKELVDTIKGIHKKCGANFDYAAPLTEVMLLGLIVANHGGKIEWDSKNMRITNRPELNQYLREPVRKGWEYGKELWKV
jgi:predicted dehydrogenase